MAVTKQFTQLDPINNGTTAADNFKLSDAIPAQHTDLTGGVNKLVHRTLAQSLCEPVAVCNSNNPSNGAYTANCSNYPDFALSYQDAQQNTHYLIGLKIRVIFTYGITYGSVSGGTYPTLNINGSGAIPMLAQGKTMASGAASAGQSIEFTIIPYGNGVAFDADSNVRESTSDYTIYTDGLKQPKIKYLYLQVTSDSSGAFNLNTKGLSISNTLLSIQSLQETYFVNYSRDSNLTYYYCRIKNIPDMSNAGNKTVWISVIYI